MSAQA
ncbi:hypothetical protein R3I93_014285 [Phoxinus phoxinus]